MKHVMLVLMLCFVVLAGCTHNLTELTNDKVYSRTSEAHTAKMDANGNMESSYHGLGQTQLMQDGDGNWTQMSGPPGVLAVPGNDRVAYIISPKDIRIDEVTYCNAEGKPLLTVKGLEANIAPPEGQQVAAIERALARLQGMTREEALATGEKWKATGEMLPTVADLLIKIISGTQ